MLKTLDILIGVATVMLLFSMAVTILTQFFTTLFRNRQRNLRDGLAGLLRHIDPGMQEAIATKLATAVLKHPLVAGQSNTMGKVVSREEFSMLLLEIAAGQSLTPVEPPVRDATVELLEKNGIAYPAGTLCRIRDIALQLEKASPELANDVRQGMAILQAASSDYVAKVHGSFDQTIDRVSDRFTQTARIWTFGAALAVAICVQLDTFALVNRLSIDDQFRLAVQKNAQNLLDEAARTHAAADQASETNTAPSPAATPLSNSTPGSDQTASTSSPSTGKKDASPTSPARDAGDNKPTDTEKNAASRTEAAKDVQSMDTRTIQKDYYNLLSTAGLVTLPGEHWRDRWAWGKVPGILLSALLLSLGAPFWYKLLQDVLRLRSALAQKDEQQRTTRQTTQTTGPGEDSSGQPAAATTPENLQGEQGDLSAVG